MYKDKKYTKLKKAIKALKKEQKTQTKVYNVILNEFEYITETLNRLRVDIEAQKNRTGIIELDDIPKADFDEIMRTLRELNTDIENKTKTNNDNESDTWYVGNGVERDEVQ